MTPKQLERFLKKTKPEGECVVWTGCKDKDGYGRISIDQTMCGTHRAIWIHHYGPIPQGIECCHRCDNPSCVKIEHLFLGTRKENAQDAACKGRTAIGERNGKYTHPESRSFGDANGSRTKPDRLRRGDNHPAKIYGNSYMARGESHGMSEVTADQVRAMRKLSAEGVTATAIAQKYGVAISTICRILRRETWKHIE